MAIYLSQWIKNPKENFYFWIKYICQTQYNVEPGNWIKIKDVFFYKITGFCEMLAICD